MRKRILVVDDDAMNLKRTQMRSSTMYYLQNLDGKPWKKLNVRRSI